ncbi:hypothetical protein HK104_006032 [Borealophlyctis nickersoniae]|nr:hypothetical protein HK104_006032 [Borealophlyctis nickersoniae]
MDASGGGEGSMDPLAVGSAEMERQTKSKNKRKADGEGNNVDKSNDEPEATQPSKKLKPMEQYDGIVVYDVVYQDNEDEKGEKGAADAENEPIDPGLSGNNSEPVHGLTQKQLTQAMEAVAGTNQRDVDGREGEETPGGENGALELPELPRCDTETFQELMSRVTPHTLLKRTTTENIGMAAQGGVDGREREETAGGADLLVDLRRITRCHLETVEGVIQTVIKLRHQLYQKYKRMAAAEQENQDWMLERTHEGTDEEGDGEQGSEAERRKAKNEKNRQRLSRDDKDEVERPKVKKEKAPIMHAVEAAGTANHHDMDERDDDTTDEEESPDTQAVIQSLERLKYQRYQRAQKRKTLKAAGETSQSDLDDYTPEVSFLLECPGEIIWLIFNRVESRVAYRLFMDTCKRLRRVGKAQHDRWFTMYCAHQWYETADAELPRDIKSPIHRMSPAAARLLGYNFRKLEVVETLCHLDEDVDEMEDLSFEDAVLWRFTDYFPRIGNFYGIPHSSIELLCRFVGEEPSEDDKVSQLLRFQKVFEDYRFDCEVLCPMNLLDVGDRLAIAQGRLGSFNEDQGVLPVVDICAIDEKGRVLQGTIYWKMNLPNGSVHYDDSTLKDLFSGKWTQVPARGDDVMSTAFQLDHCIPKIDFHSPPGQARAPIPRVLCLFDAQHRPYLSVVGGPRMQLLVHHIQWQVLEG